MDQQQNNPPRRRNLFVSFLSGMASFAIVDFIWDKIATRYAQKRGGIFAAASMKTKITWLAGAGIFAVALDAYRNNRDAQRAAATLPPDQPPAPPAQPDRPAGLELANIPQILDLLVEGGALTREQQTHVLEQIKQGRQGFAADIAVADGFITKQQAETALGRQAMKKAEAAVSDIQNIQTHGPIPAPAWLTANWGNSGVNPAAAQPTRTDGVSAAANIAQNLVMLANANPALAPQLFNGVIAAVSLANGIALGDSPVTPIAKLGDAWLKTVNMALIAGAAGAPQLMVDSHGNPIKVEDFMYPRNTEIAAAITLTLQHPPQQGKGHSR